MATVALGGFAGLLATAFGWRTVLHRRRTGMSGWLPPPTPAAWVGDGLFTAGALATLAAPALELTGMLRPAPALDRRPRQSLWSPPARRGSRNRAARPGPDGSDMAGRHRPRR